MRRAFAALLLLTPAPALATGGFSCTTGTGSVGIDVVTGHGAVPAVVQVRVREGRKLYSTFGEGEPVMLAQSWIDGRGLKLDLVDPQALRHIARLNVLLQPRASDASGTLFLNQRRYRVRCTGEQ